MCIPGEDVSQRNKHPHREWECASPGMHTVYMFIFVIQNYIQGYIQYLKESKLLSYTVRPL